MRTYQYLSGLGEGRVRADGYYAVPTRDVQRVLRDRGFDTGPIDNIYGQRTANALSQAIGSTNVVGGFHSANPRDAEIAFDSAETWDAVRALPIQLEPTVIPTGGGGASTIGPHLDPFPRAGARPSAAASTGINWPVVIGAGVLAFGLGWFFLNKRRRGRGRVLRAELVRSPRPKRLTQ